MKVKRKELERLYKSMTIKELSKKLRITKPTLYKLLREADIELKGKDGFRRRKKVELID